jgi:hypothetical protein
MPSPVCCEPARVRLEVGGDVVSAEALEMSGHRAAVRSGRALPRATEVRLLLDWDGGTRTVLPGVVAASAPASGGFLAHVELAGVEGDWESFLAYVGPAAAIG